MAYVNYIGTALPEFPLDQDKVREMGKRILKGKVPFLDQALGLFTNAGVEQRRLVRDIDEILDNDDLGWRNNIFKECSIELGIRMMEEMFEKTGVGPQDIDMIITTSCTGFMIPAVDAFLINHFNLRPDIKRLPITELGCAAGAMATSRAAEYLKAYPDHKVVVMAIELPSLTYRTKDFRVANLVSAALFGDGAATMLMSGETGPCKILEHQTHFFRDTPDLMGFDLSASGFKIILDKKISELVSTDFLEPLKAFLDKHGRRPEDIRHFVFHPGGRRIMDTLRDILGIDESELSASRKVLREVGNLSSASIIWVLKETLEKNPKGLGLLAAFGPGFNAELLTVEF